MCIHLHFANLIVFKNAIKIRYKGGLQKFREDYILDENNYYEEDSELISISKMNSDGLCIEPLIDSGLHWDEDQEISTDFTILTRFGTYLWKVNWIDNNNLFAWYKYSSVEANNI